MSTLGTLRGDVADLITEATTLPSFAYNPERLIPPCAVVMPAPSYVESGNTFGSFLFRFTVDLVMGAAANSVSSSGLDEQIENAIVALVNAGYSVEGVGQPYQLEANNGAYLTATLTITTTTQI